MKLSIKKFDLNNIHETSIINIIGKRATGKTTLVRDILYHNNNSISNTLIFNTSEEAVKEYSNIFNNVQTEYNPLLLEYYNNKQLEFRKNNNGYYNYSSMDTDMIVFDDLMYDTSLVKDNYFKRLMFNSIHLKTGLILTMSTCLGLPPCLRANIDYVFILRENMVSNRKRLYEQYAGMFPTFDVFCQVMDQFTNNYECLVIDNTSRSNNIEDIVYWYKADLHTDEDLNNKLNNNNVKDINLNLNYKSQNINNSNNVNNSNIEKTNLDETEAKRPKLT